MTRFDLRVLTGKKHAKVKLQRLRMNIVIWVVGTSNQLFIRGSKTETKILKKTSWFLAELRSL